MVQERRSNGESKFGTKWMLFGQDPGLKTQDLIHFSENTLIGVTTLAGIGIGASLFDETLAMNGLGQDATAQDLLGCQLPTSLTQVNSQIASLLPDGIPVAVRSSAKDERGGSGVYTTRFITPSGNLQQDSAALEEAEKEVYGSYFTEQAKIYQKGAKNHGMALLVQPVMGDRYGNNYMPAFSGVMTVVDSVPTLRLVVGLGTKAVDKDEAIVLTRDNISVDSIAPMVRALQQADAINLSTGHVQTVEMSDEMRERVAHQLPKLALLIDAYQRYKPPHYWEFAIDEQSELPFIVQAAPEERQAVAIQEFEAIEGEILYRGEDVVNTGITRGRGIVIVGASARGYGPEDLAILRTINKATEGCIVVLPDTVFTRAGGREQKVDLSHFSNAAGVIEIQTPKVSYAMGMTAPMTVNHTKSGGAHFSVLCSRFDILFLGVQSKSGHYEDVLQLGEMTEPFGLGSGYWDVAYKMTNTPTEGRVEIMGKPTIREYTADQLDRWSQELGNMGVFNVIIDCIAAASKGNRWNLTDFNPFRIIEKVQKDEIPLVLKQIKEARQNLWLLDSYAEYEEVKNYEEDAHYPLEMYLRRVISMLTKKLHIETP